MENRIKEHMNENGAEKPKVTKEMIKNKGKERDDYELIMKTVRSSGYAWTSYVTSWLLFLDYDEIIVLSCLFNIWSLAARPVKSREELLAQQGKLRRFSLANATRWEYDPETSQSQAIKYSKLSLPFFWCSIRRLREECNLTARQEKYILGKLKSKNIIRWRKKEERRYLCIDTVQLDFYLVAAMNNQMRDCMTNKRIQPGRNYIDWHKIP